jgi:cysteine desulfurase
VVINGGAVQRLPNTLNVSVTGVAGSDMVMALDLEGIAVSSGSACSSGSHQPSEVLLAMGYAEELAGAAVRFSLGYATTREEIDRVTEVLPRIVGRLRASNSASASNDVGVEVERV